MTITDICVNLEIARELKEAGYPQESLFWWEHYHSKTSPKDIADRYELLMVKKPDFENEYHAYKYYAAPTASELGEKLPKWI